MKIGLLLTLFLFPLIAYSQKPAYVMGPVYQTSRGISDFSVLYASDTETIILRGGTKGFGFGVMTTLAIGVAINFNTLTIDKYDKDFKLVKTVKAKGAFGKELLFLGTIEVDDIQHLILADVGSKTVDLFRAEIDPDSLSLKAKPVQITSLAINSKKNDELMFTWSPDKSKMVFVSRNTSLTDKNKSLSIQVLDKTFNELWNSQAELDVEKTDSRTGEISLSNNGDVFVMVSKSWTKKQSKKHTLDYYYSLFKVSQGAVKEMPLSFEEYELNNASVICLPGKLVVQGYCINRGEWGDWDDVTALYTIVAGYDMSPGKIQVSYFTSRGENMFDPLVKRDAGRPITETPFIYTRSKTYYPNGDCLIAGEALRSGQTANTVNRMTFTHFSFDHSNILLVYVKADGTIKFAKRIIKEQSQTDENLYASVVTGWNDNKTIFLYNDDKRNPTDKNACKWTTRKFEESQLVIAMVDEEGVIKKYKCIDNALNETCIIPADCGSVREGEVIVVGSRFHRLAKTEVQVGKVVFK